MTGYDPDFPLVGETLGLWRLVRGLGRGGMGEVYEAVYDYIHLLTLKYPPEERGMIRRELERLPRTEQARLASEMLGTPLPAEARFAIKVCNARANTAGHRRFLQEADMACRLGDHPYIVTMHAVNGAEGLQAGGALPLDAGKYRDVAFMVMDLAERAYDHTTLSIDQAVWIVRCIATALDHAHQQGIIHRDLKPENILGTIERPLLTDFGIAKELDQSLGLTRTGQVIGTLDYMSPEQAIDAKGVDHRSDIYSLGVVLYEFATGGKLPYIHFSERDAALTAIRSERSEPKWPSEHLDDFPKGLERIILKAMAHRVEERYQEMSALIGDLDGYTRGEWLSPLGRVAPRRWFRHFLRVHPRFAVGIPVVLILLLLTWVGREVAVGLDRTRVELNQGVGELRRHVELLEGHLPRMPSLAEHQQLFGQLGVATRIAANARNYPAIAAQFDELVERYLRRRYLKLSFVGPTPDAKAGPMLAALAGVSDPGWHHTQHGLRITDPRVRLELSPFGDGVVTMMMRVELPRPQGFGLTVQENSDPRHVTSLRIDEHHRLRLSTRRDEHMPVEIGTAVIPGGSILSVYLIIDHRGVRAWINDEEQGSVQAPALRERAQASLRLDLPQEAVLKEIELWPRLPQL